VDNGVARMREVTTGRVQDGRQPVLSGLKPGDLVATSGLSKLHDGVKVRVREASPSREGGSAGE
jgi:multidrug efflux pump subunit AcrA (membrane-fusion protein)